MIPKAALPEEIGAALLSLKWPKLTGKHPVAGLAG
jgi:hypothetical protein